MMDVASAILVLQLQVEDNEEILAISNRQEDFHAALTLHLFDLRERLQVLQDHSMAFRPLGAVGQETLDGIFGPYHAPSTSQEPLEPKLSASSSLKDDERAANRPADHEPEPHLDESTRTTSQEAGQVADLGPQLQVHESIDSPISASSSALHHSKRKAEELAGQEELNDPKQRKLSEDAHRNDSLEVEVLSYDMIATEANPDLVTSGDVLVNVESGLQQDASPETFHDTVVASVISEGPARCPCVACLTIFAEDSLIQCPCDHKYCAQCLTEHFRAGLQGIAFPPSCCYEEIPFTLAQPHLSIKLQANYAKKKRVIDNPGTIYCALLSCQALIAPENISNGRATCVCMTITCVVCKFTAHDDACPEDTERAALLQLAVTQGLRACYRCGELYERDFGCNHMTCTRCSAEFCYNCGRNWRTCSCGSYENQAGPLIRTGEVVDNRVVPAPAAVVAHVPTRTISYEYLQEFCEHEDGWDKIIHPDADCQECGYDSGYFLFRCSECLMYSCARCLPDDE